MGSQVGISIDDEVDTDIVIALFSLNLSGARKHNSTKHSHIGCESTQDKAETRSPRKRTFWYVRRHRSRQRSIALTHELGDYV